jgi:MazG family protein
MSAALERLLGIMVALRDRERGCPWDREQDWASIAPHTIEEAYEVADAIESGRPDAVRDELGDLLFQVVFQARIAEEAGHFDFDAVAATIADKLERRHPHVFGDARIDDAAEQGRAWEAHKARERAERGTAAGGALDGVALGLPALLRAAKLGRRAARVRFDWPDAEGVLAKVDEEFGELRGELGSAQAASGDAARVAEEFGDLLFTLAQLARKLEIDAEGALRGANRKFERRFAWMEAQLRADGRRAEDCTAEELEALWSAAKGAGL